MISEGAPGALPRQSAAFKADRVDPLMDVEPNRANVIERLGCTMPWSLMRHHGSA